MVHTTTMTCDKCGDTHTISTKRGRTQWWRMQLFIDSEGRNPSAHVGTPDIQVEWCDECARAKGLVGKPPEPEPDVTPPTASERLEELIREIACEEIHDATGA